MEDSQSRKMRLEKEDRRKFGWGLVYIAFIIGIALAFATNNMWTSDWFQDIFFHQEHQERKWKEKLSSLWESQDIARKDSTYCALELEKRRRTAEIELAQDQLLNPEMAMDLRRIKAIAWDASVENCRQKQRIYQQALNQLRQTEIEYQAAVKKGF